MALTTPEFGNKYSNRYKILHNKNLSGQSRFARRSIDITLDFIDQTSKFNTLVAAAAFRATILAANATETTLTDFEGNVWTGYYDPDSIIIKRGRGTCEYEVSFRFIGTYVAP